MARYQKEWGCPRHVALVGKKGCPNCLKAGRIISGVRVEDVTGGGKMLLACGEFDQVNLPLTVHEKSDLKKFFGYPHRRVMTSSNRCNSGRETSNVRRPPALVGGGWKKKRTLALIGVIHLQRQKSF